MNILQLIREIMNLQSQWELMTQPKIGIFGTMSYKKLNFEELEKTIRIQNLIKDKKNELKKSVGLVKYIKIYFKYLF